jgi:NDP-sugar pyrophosphorylase family protein
MGKERISLSINKELLHRLDKEVDHVTIQSRSGAVEKILTKYLSEKKKCVILAGGPPENLDCEGTYRPLLKLKGIPLIEHILAKVREHGFNDIIIVGSKEVLSSIYKLVGETKGDAIIEYIEEKKSLGTAKTLQLAKERIKSTFLFVPCDHYFEINLKDMGLYHKQNKSVATLTVYSGTKYAWSKSSIVELEGNKIKTYEENPKVNKTYLTSILIGFAEPEIFDAVPDGEISYSLQEDVFPQLAKEGSLIGYLFAGKWKNIHTKKDLNF